MYRFSMRVPMNAPLREGGAPKGRGENATLGSRASSARFLALADALGGALRDLGHCQMEELVDSAVPKAQHLNPLCRQKHRAALVVGPSLLRIVLRAVEFHHEARPVAVEVGDIGANGLLPLKAHGEVTEAIVPKMTLLRRHVGAQDAGKRDVFADVAYGHGRHCETEAA